MGISMFNKPSRLISVGSTVFAGADCASTAQLAEVMQKKARPEKTPFIILVEV
jgi:hypothetical protein